LLACWTWARGQTSGRDAGLWLCSTDNVRAAAVPGSADEFLTVAYLAVLILSAGLGARVCVGQLPNLWALGQTGMPSRLLKGRWFAGAIHFAIESTSEFAGHRSPSTGGAKLELPFRVGGWVSRGGWGVAVGFVRVFLSGLEDSPRQPTAPSPCIIPQ